MKKSKKLLSVLLAFVMVLSAVAATFAASAADAYKPTYSDDVTEKDVADLIGDLNTILGDALITGDTLETIYKALPALKSLVMLNSASDASDKGEFYKETNAERFGTFPAGQIVADSTDEEGNLIPGTFTTFFEENPIEINSDEEFKTELLKIVEMVFTSDMNNLFSTLAMVAAILSPDEKTSPAIDLGDGLDMVCEALGIEQVDGEGNPIHASEALGFQLYFTQAPYSRANVVTYVSNILDALLPDPVNNVLGIVQTAVSDGSDVELYAGLSQALNQLGLVIEGLEAALFGALDLSGVKEPIDNVVNTFNSLPTTGEGDNTKLDIEGTITTLVMSLTDNALGIAFVEDPSKTQNVPGATISIRFRNMQLDRVQNAQSDADILKIVYDYLYENLVANETNNGMLKIAVNAGILDGVLGTEIPPETKEYIISCLNMTNDELAQEAIVAAAKEAGRELEQPTEPPTDPVTDPSTDPDDGDTDPTTEPTTEPTTAADGDDEPVKNVDIPKTGKSFAVTGFALVSLAAAAGIVVIARKKEN